MIKLENWRCKDCEEDEEVFVDSAQEFELAKCKKCGGTLKKFNFKNNCDRYRFCDEEGADDDDWG